MRPVRSVSPEDEAAALIAAFEDPELRAVAVVTEYGELLGAFTDEDLLAACLPLYVLEDEALARVLEEDAGEELRERLVGKRVKDLVDPAHKQRPTADPDDTLVEVAAAMIRSSDPAVLVVEDRVVVGVITVDALLPALLAARER